MREYELWVNMNYGCILFMSKYDLCVNMNYWLILIMGGGTDKHRRTQTQTALFLTKSGTRSRIILETRPRLHRAALEL